LIPGFWTGHGAGLRHHRDLPLVEEVAIEGTGGSGDNGRRIISSVGPLSIFSVCDRTMTPTFSCSSPARFWSYATPIYWSILSPPEEGSFGSVF
jgi:hypothetical protein